MISNLTIKPKQVLPAFHFPTTIVLVDDDSRLLNSISLSLSKYFLFQLYDNAKDALHFFNEQYQATLSNSFCFDKLEDGKLSLNLNKILNIVYKNNRFKEVACVITDYAMPFINGLDFLQEMPERHGFEPQIQKIMLTGEAEYSIALQAFKEQLISAFYKKNEDYMEELIEKIQTIQRHYFEDATLKIAICLRDDMVNRTIALIDQKFIDLFKSHLKEKNICEYYLLDKQGSFLLLTPYGKTSVFLTRNDLGMANDLTFAREAQAPNEVINALEQKTHLLFIDPSISESANSTFDWKKYLFPCTVLTGAEKYYYATPETVPVSIDESKIVSLVNYRESCVV